VKLAVASGKGGTGKTTVAVNLAAVFDGPVQLVDCDVEAPNAGLFLKPEALTEEIITTPVPGIIESLCTRCGECSRFCGFSAIACVGSTPPLLFPQMCHSCGGCVKVCPEDAIFVDKHRIGTVGVGRAGSITLIQGTLDVGSTMAPPLISRVKERIDPGLPAILDAPPGTSCPVMATLKGVDYAILVTEPTPFGLHDLHLAVETLRELGTSFGVVVNRLGIGDHRVHRYCEEQNIPVLLQIPDDRRIAEACSRGELIVKALPEYRGLFQELLREVRNR
jgi:MinD superfamily P-loop ATPase